MIRNRTRNQLLIILLAVGFFIGILYENMFAPLQLFHTEYLERFRTSSFESRIYLFYILKIRLLSLVCILFLWNFKWRRIVICIFCVCVGFFLGRILVSLILFQGIKGIVLCIGMFFPHMLFYIFAYLMLIMHLFNNRRRQWNRGKTMVFLVVFVLGICCEVYCNPKIVKFIIEWL